MLEARRRGCLVSDGATPQPAPPIFYDPDVDPPPSAFDVVWCIWPLGSTGGFKPRPVLVRKRLRDETNPRHFAIEVCYGTSKIQKHYKGSFYVENDAKMNLLSLPQATRFELGQTRRMPWGPQFFPKRAEDGAGPILGRLDTVQIERVKRIAWEMQSKR